MNRVILGLVAAAALVSAVLLPILPAKATMVTSSGQDMSMQCPSCHLAPDCSTSCSLVAAPASIGAMRLIQTPFQMEPSRLVESYASLLAKPPPRSIEVTTEV